MKIKIMKPFNLEEARAGKPVCTRDGKKARILCTNLIRYNYCIVAAVINPDLKFEEVFLYTSKGEISEGAEKEDDLMMVEDEKPKCPFKPFDKVLVRDTDMSKWDCEFFSQYLSDKPHPFYCLHNVYTQCIPYNEETSHLIGTTDAAPEKYVIW